MWLLSLFVWINYSSFGRLLCVRPKSCPKTPKILRIPMLFGGKKLTHQFNFVLVSALIRLNFELVSENWNFCSLVRSFVHNSKKKFSFRLKKREEKSKNFCKARSLFNLFQWFLFVFVFLEIYLWFAFLTF